ncbi:RE2, partial [Symbiodinium microadriaticum]
QVEHLADSAPDQEDGFETILKELDRVYQYDARVEMPKAFEKFFYGLTRPAGQTLIHYCSNHREAARELENHDVKLPDAVGGWLLLRRASLSQEQRQLVLSQLENKKLSVSAVEQSLFYLFGQDYRSSKLDLHRPTGRGRGYSQAYRWQSSRTQYAYSAEDDDALDYPETEYADEADYGYYEDEPESYDEHEAPAEDFAETTYYGLDEEDEETEEAYAAYLDARRRLAEVKASRGYYPVVAVAKLEKAELARQSQKEDRRANHNVLPFPLQKEEPVPTPPGAYDRQKGEAMMAGSRSDLRAATIGRIVGLQDGGASSIVGGHGFIMDVEKGVHPDSFLFARTNKTFLFGGDNRSVADWCVHLPVWVGGVHGRIQCFLVSGEMPVLIGRPILKALKVKMDYDHDQVSIMGEPWTEALVGPKGEYLLALDDGLSPDTLDTEYGFDYVTDDCDDNFVNQTTLLDMDTYLRETGRTGPAFLDEGTMAATLVETQEQESNVYPQTSASGLAPAVECALPPNIWKSIGYGINRCRNHLDHILEAAYRAAETTQATFCENMNVRTDQDHELLEATRDYHRHTHLKFTRRVFLRMSQYGIVVLEHPLSSRAWTTPAFHDLGLPIHVDQCALGATLPNLHGIDTPIKKATKLVTNYRLLTETLGAYRCDGSHPHQALIQQCARLGSRAKAAGTYQPAMCERIAECLERAYYAYFVYGGSATEDALPASDVDMEEYDPSDGPEHRVGAERRRRMVYEAAQKYQCPTCKKLAPPAQVPKSTLRTTYRFNERLLADTIWLQVLDKLDTDVWAPDLPDSHRSWGSDEMMHFTTEHGIELVISPGEAHERLAQLERRHQVLRRAVELYLEDNPPTGSGPESLIEALTLMVPQLNQSLSVGGFSPTQWVLGYQPTVPGSLLDSNVNYSHLDPSTAFHYKMECRVRAATAVVKADTAYEGRCYDNIEENLRSSWLDNGASTGARQQDQTPPTVYWLVHGAALIRAAPEHVRPDLENATLAADTPALHALVRKVQNRGARDLFRTNRKRRREDLADTDQEDTDHEGDNPPDDPPPSTRGLPFRRHRLPPACWTLHQPRSCPAYWTLPNFPLRCLLLLHCALLAVPFVRPGSCWWPTSRCTVTGPLRRTSPNVDPDTDDEDGGDGGADGTSSTTAPSTSDRPGSVTGASSSTPPSNTENRSPGEGTQHRLHPIFEAGANETFNQKSARLDRSETISYGPPPRPPAVHPVFKAPPFETFNQRRARLDPSETISYGPQPLPAGERPQPYPDQGPTTEHGFTVDVLDHDMEEDPSCHCLPEGWVIDEHGYMVLEEIYDTCKIKGTNLIRHHYVARNTLFHPQETGDCPIPVHMLTNVRQSYQGGPCHQDRWRNSKEKEGIWWTGRTVFKIATRDRHMAQTAFYTSTGGAPTYGGPKEKRQKDAKTLNERALSLADRLAFIDAKRKELGSFFTNSVWEFGTESEAPPGRILKAHFILKWSKNPDGTPRAKARLIIQGFRDPDALAGLVDSTSPTLSRLGRTTLFSLTTLKQWTTFVADVSTAFLQGPEHAPSRTLWVRLPADARQLLGVTDPKVCVRLRKPMYGLCDAPRAWYDEASRRLEQAGFTKHSLDACLFLYFAPDLRCAVGLHVDDLLGTSSPDSKDFIKKSLLELFSFRDYREDQDEFEFLGVSVKKEAHGGHSCGHDNYLAKLKPITLDKGRMSDPESPATDKEHRPPRPEVCQGQQRRSPSAYSDAAFASRADLSSQGGYMICLSPQTVLEGKVCGYHLLDWRSFKLPRVARSTLAAEGEAADCLRFAVVFWKAMLDPEFRISERWWGARVLLSSMRPPAPRGALRTERQYADGLTKDTATQLLAASRKKTASRPSEECAAVCAAEAYRDDVTGAVTYYVPQTFSDYRDLTPATTFTETRNRWCQTDSALLTSPVQTAEGLVLDLQLVRAYNQRLASAVHRQQQALNYHTEYRLEHRHIGELYVTPHGRAWHCSEDCARSRTANNVRTLTPCSYCTSAWIQIPEYLRNNPRYDIVPAPSTAAASSSSTTTVFAVSGEIGGS